MEVQFVVQGSQDGCDWECIAYFKTYEEAESWMLHGNYQPDFLHYKIQKQWSWPF